MSSKGPAAGSGEQELTCSIIGSFRKYYSEVVSLIEFLETCHIHVLSPKRSSIVNPQEWFVRLQTDDPEYEPVEIELIALHRILRSNFVYVLCPAGYVGKTTSYEIGCIHERGIPLYFSEQPEDLPIAVATSAIISPKRLTQHLVEHRCLPAIVVAEIPQRIRELQIRLQRREYIE